MRDPAAYLKRHELANPTAFDRDFNFITGIERSLERAEREVERRGVTLPSEEELALNADEEGVGAAPGAGKKRKRETLVKGEAGFLRGAEASGVRVVRAPRGMTRNKENTSRWHLKYVLAGLGGGGATAVELGTNLLTDTNALAGQWNG